jgi:hypothetical protein
LRFKRRRRKKLRRRNNMARNATPKTAYYTKRHLEMIKEIMEEKGYPTFSAVAHQALIQLHSSIFKEYVSSRKRGAEIKKPRAEVREEDEMAAQFALCEQLDGKVIQNETGNPVCVYFQYQSKNRFEQEVPVAMLEEIHTARQYQPSRAKVEKLQEEKKVNY